MPGIRNVGISMGASHDVLSVFLPPQANGDRGESPSRGPCLGAVSPIGDRLNRRKHIAMLGIRNNDVSMGASRDVSSEFLHP